MQLVNSAKYKLSKYAFFLTEPDGDRLACFNSENLEILYLDAQAKDYLLSFTKAKEVSTNADMFSVSQVLVEKGFLIDADIDERVSLEKNTIREQVIKKKQLEGGKVKLNAFRLILTEKCNFGCEYCFVKNRKESDLRDMSMETLIKGIDFLAQQNEGDYIELHFFGGEPLIKFQMIELAVGHVEKLVKEGKIKGAYYGLTTNGTLMTEAIATFLAEKCFLVSVSLDGSDEINKLNRRYLSGGETTRDVTRGIKLLQKCNNEIAILVTPVTNNLMHLSESCEYIIKTLGVKSIFINTPQPTNGDWAVDGRIFSNELKRCSVIAKKYGIVINHFGTRVLTSLNEKKKMTFSCSKMDNDYAATLNADGFISPCIISWEHKDTLSRIDDFSFDGNFSRWKLEMPYGLNMCKNCLAMNVCGGPCPLEIYEQDKDISGQSSLQRCVFFNDYLPWAIFYEE